MSDEPYVPNEQEIIEGSVVSEDEARRGIAKIKADALREAELALRETSDDGPYVRLTGYVADGWGYDCGDINHGYANWLEERADRIEEEA